MPLNAWSLFAKMKAKQGRHFYPPCSLSHLPSPVLIAVHVEIATVNGFRNIRVIQLGVFSLVHFVEDVPLIRVGEVRDVLA